ncbi:MAG: hypothetical protein DME36_05255 [Verrucomicrobia bacterium]|nr:MAG: hypothetical protein DME36_05255 [Verrucomicrobiota bacterium]
MLKILVSSEMDTLVKLETPKVAVSNGPLGGVGEVQLAELFQSPFAGLRSHVPLSAQIGATPQQRRNTVIGGTRNLELSGRTAPARWSRLLSRASRHCRIFMMS